MKVSIQAAKKSMWSLRRWFVVRTLGFTSLKIPSLNGIYGCIHIYIWFTFIYVYTSYIIYPWAQCDLVTFLSFGNIFWDLLKHAMIHVFFSTNQCQNERSLSEKSCFFVEPFEGFPKVPPRPHWFKHFGELSEDYPPWKLTCPLTSQRFWVDDFRSFPFGGIC